MNYLKIYFQSALFALGVLLILVLLYWFGSSSDKITQSTVNLMLTSTGLGLSVTAFLLLIFGRPLRFVRQQRFAEALFSLISTIGFMVVITLICMTVLSILPERTFSNF